MNRAITRSLLRIGLVSVLGLGIGGAASLSAIAFVEAVLWLNQALLISPYARIQFEQQPMLVAAATVLVPTLGGLAVGLLVHRLIAVRRGLGPPDAILAVQTRQPLPGLRASLGSTLAALISLGCGASVGQYGPLVYLGAFFGGLAARLRLPLQDLQAIAIGCGVAAAIATAFNAPIAGLVFAHEVILRHYSLLAFAPITVASATGYVVANVIFERQPLFLVEFAGVAYSHEFLFFAVEGVLAAGLAGAFMGLIRLTGGWARALPVPGAVRPALAGLVLGACALAVPEVLGIGKETLRFATIEGAFGAGELAGIVAAKVMLTAVCIGFGFVGGVFSPALLIGILAGALYSLVLSQGVSLPQSGLVVYAISGMMAVASPIIGAPLTMILIVFELTRNYDLTIAAMVAVVFSNLVAYRVFGPSLFDQQLARAGFDLSFGRDKAILGAMPVATHAREPEVRLAPQTSVGTAIATATAAGRSEAVVVDGAGRYQGLVALSALQGVSPASPIEPFVDTGAMTFDETTSIWTAMNRMRAFVGEAVPVVHQPDRRLLGVVSEGAVIEAYLEAVHDLRREENASA